MFLPRIHVPEQLNSDLMHYQWYKMQLASFKLLRMVSLEIASYVGRNQVSKYKQNIAYLTLF